jgi:hypothetical protein
MNSQFSYLTQQQENKWVFYAAGNSWQVWEKPDGCNMIHIVVIGAGSGGGGGYQRIATANGGGGGGGAAGGIYTMMIPAYTIPDKLHIQVGVGGGGGANLTSGSSGTPTYIGLVPDTTNFSANMLIRQTYGGGDRGGAGSVTGGAGGNGGGTTIQWFLNFTGWGKTVQTVAGQSGQAGTTPSTDFDQTRIIGGGAGGAFAAASTQAVGRSVTSLYKQPSAVVYSVGQQPIGSSINAGNGANLISPQPQFFGGAGGSALTSATTVNGGAGGIGCGGGGAGVCLTGRTGIGGRGGDGMVIITCW